MKRIRLPISLVLFALAVAIRADPASAQGTAASSGDRVEAHLAALDRRLDLTASQEESIRLILKEQRAQLKALGAQASGDGSGKLGELRRQLQSIQGETTRHIEAVLVGDQVPAFRTHEAERKEQRRDEVTDFILDHRVGELDERLGLTHEQAARIRPILAEHMEEQQALLEEAQSEKRRLARLRTMKKIRSIQEDIDDRIDAVLTKEQQRAYRKYRDEQREAMQTRLRDRG